MSLLGVISREPMHVRTKASRGRGWSLVVQEASNKWTKSIEHGAGGGMTVHAMSSEWRVFRAEARRLRASDHVMGDLFVATVTSLAGKACMLDSPKWHFVYEGTIDDCVALRDALDPIWTPEDDVPSSPGELIFAHILACLGDAFFTPDMAMAKVASDLHRAAKLGSAAFLCADQTNLYAYALGERLLFKNVSDAIVVGSADVVSEGPATLPLQDGALVALARRPQLGWAVLAHP